jgi:spermidine synthase
MSWKSYLFPQTILITSSAYNRHIRVNEEWGKMKLLVDGSSQSGAYIEKLWKKALERFSIGSHLPFKKILVLGVGGGTVISLFHDVFPHVDQTCVDIDKVIIDIAKEYFSIGQIPNIILIEVDAQKYVQQLVKEKKMYDCIVVDLFSGPHVPEFVCDERFLRSLRGILTKDGCVLINYLREREYKKKSDKLYTSLQNVFGQVKDFPIACNRFFYAKH